MLTTLVLAWIPSWASTFTWTRLVSGNASGSWSNQSAWSGATLPTTTNDTAAFNALDITADSTVTLDGNQTIKTVLFGDTNSSSGASWLLNVGSLANATLTLGGPNPSLVVSNLAGGKAAVINAVLAGTNGLTKTGSSYLQLNAINPYTGGTVLSGTDCRFSLGNDGALGGGKVLVGANPGDGEVWFQSAGSRTLTNDFEIRTIRWIIDWNSANGVAAGDLTVNGNLLLNSGSANVRDIFCGQNLTLNGNVTVTPATNPFNKQGGSTLTLNGTNTFSGPTAVNGGTLLVNGALNSPGTVTVLAGTTLGGTGVLSGPLALQGTLQPGTNGAGTLTLGSVTPASTGVLSFAFGTTNNPANGRLNVNGNLTLAGTVNFSDLGGFGPGTYSGIWYSGSLLGSNFTIGLVPGGYTVAVLTNLAHYVQFLVLNGRLSPTPGQPVPMDLAAPLTLSWVQVPQAVAYDLFFGTSSNAVFLATTNTPGVYQGRTSVLTGPVGSLLPNTTYYWRVDGVAADGTITAGGVLSFTTGAPMVDLMEDTWVATDALGRSLPGLAECGSPRSNRPIGLFYYLWHKASSFGSGTNWDVSQYLAAHPYTNPHNPWADNPIFQTALATYWWGQPELGYYDPSDPWMLRRQLALLNHAGVDVLIFDYSNAVTYDAALDALCDTIRQMRFEGYSLHLKIVFLTHAKSGQTATYLYNTLYGQGKYADLWYYWQGKPLILGYINGSGSGDIVPSSTVQNFFTWRASWAFVATNSLQDQWQWIDRPTPQNWGYDTRGDLPEEVPVSCGGWANGNLGKSQSNNSQQDYDAYHLPLQRTSRLGIFFKEQMNYGLKYDPQFLFLTQWNEWIAGSYAAPVNCYTHLLADCCPVNGFYFVDEYNEEYSRDLEPMKGGHTDNYYFQMVGQNRLRKGVRPVPSASAPQSINLAGDFSQWTTVAPSYYDPANDTLWRNFPGASATQMGTYTNYTGRNDFTVLKVARDADNLYFFAQCNSNLTSYTDTNWMVLFLDTDQNHATGWEGYDFALNLGPRTAATTTLSRNTTTTNGWVWTTVRSDIPYTVSGNQLMVAVPRSSLGLGGDPIQFDFHWADNFQINDIADFGVDGDSAPDRRFNYRYVTTTNTEVVLLSDDFESGKQSVWGATWTNGSQWDLTSASPYSGNHCAVGTYAASGQSNLLAAVNTYGYGSFRLSFHYKLANVLNAQALQVSYLTTNGWVPIRQLSRDEFYPANQSWSYDERQNVWLNFVDTRFNCGPDARFFTTNFAFRIDASALTAAGQSVYVDDVSLTGDTQMPAPVGPQTWQTQDIGNAGNVGAATTNSTGFTVSGSGLDIWNNGDAFRLVYLTHSGDGQFSARVTGLTPTDPWAKAGVMIRESLDTGARHALMALTPSNGLVFQQRATALGNSASSSSGPSVAAPYWLRIARSGDNFSGYASSDGKTWTQVGSVSIPGFNNTALWGLAVTAHNNTLTNTAAFDQVRLMGGAPLFPPIPNQTVTAGQTLVVTNAASDPNVPPQPLTFAAAVAPTNAAVDAASGVFTWRPLIAQSPLVTRIQLTAQDTTGLSATQSFWVTVNRPVQPQLGAVTWTNGAFGLRVFGDTGPDYFIQGTTNLAQADAWTTLWVTNAPTVPFWWQDPKTNLPQRFYRVLLGP